MARAVLLATFLTLVAFSVAPTASAASAPAAAPCIVGNEPDACLVSVEFRVCVTEPCDEMDVCLLFGRICPA